MPIAEHLVATTRRGDRTLLQPERAAWSWQRLRAGLPDALSCVLMPDHVHVVAAPGCRRRLVRVLAMHPVRFDVLPAEPAHSAEIAIRMMRYGLWNPVRAGLVDDPWAWRWSTLRDLGACTHPPWTELRAVAGRLRKAPRVLLAAVTTNADGHAAPPGAASVDVASLPAVVDAARVALRLPPGASPSCLRALVVQTCDAIGSFRCDRVAQVLGCTDRTVRRLRAQPHAGVPAVLRCLVDPRLRAAP